ncbi:glutaredoxin family protein [Leucobacter sp. OH2974_COT-288]|nr:glutaredoxin family protein [Leucobacter sp. OH2974_COT-288]
MASEVVELTLVGKPDCHLCDDAKEVIERVRKAAASNEIGLQYVEVNILENSQMAEKYGEEIPVVLLNGSPYASFHIYEDKLAYAILHERDRMRAKARRWWRRRK